MFSLFSFDSADSKKFWNNTQYIKGGIKVKVCYLSFVVLGPGHFTITDGSINYVLYETIMWGKSQNQAEVQIFIAIPLYSRAVVTMM